MKTIAVCFNLPSLEAIISDPLIGKRYPGAGWMPHLVSYAKGLGMDVLSGEQALRYVQNGMLDPTNIQVVQEETNSYGVALINMGAEASVLTCLESPIFTPRFYDHVESIKQNFKASILFHGGTHQLYFPSFDDEDLIEPLPMRQKKLACMVVSNKHYSMLKGYDDSPSFKIALATQLHDYRYGAIEYFYDKPGFQLYGKGWGEGAIACDNKLAVLQYYKFNLCFENGIYPGYMTEKLVDALVGGCIPVYRGGYHPHIPTHAIVNGGDFKSFESLYQYLLDLDEAYSEHLIKEGQAWIRSEDGQMHNNRVWAKRLLEILA